MHIDRVDGVALWRQIATTLQQEIRHGLFEPGARLPTEQTLARRFGVNRHTVRRAIAALAEDGLVTVEQGRGTFVDHDVLDYVVGKRTRFNESLTGGGHARSRALLDARTVTADRTLADALGLRVRARVEVLEMLSHVDDRPLSLATHYFPARRFAGIAQAWRDQGSITAAIASLGVDDYTRRTTRVTARPAQPEEWRHLGLSRHRPVLVTESINVDAQNVPIEYGVTRFAADRVQLVLET